MSITYTRCEYDKHLQYTAKQSVFFLRSCSEEIFCLTARALNTQKIRTVLQSTFTVVYTIIYSRGFKV